MKIKRFKLNALSVEGLRQKELNAIVGGAIVCYCSCYYANSGGSSSNNNSGANYAIGDGSYSPAGCNQYITVDGTTRPPLPLLNETMPV